MHLEVRLVLDFHLEKVRICIIVSRSQYDWTDRLALGERERRSHSQAFGCAYSHCLFVSDVC